MTIRRIVWSLVLVMIVTLAYLILSAPDGGALFYDGRRSPARTKGSWAAWVKGLPLPARVTRRFSIPLSEASPGGLAPGLYAWHVVLTEAGTYRILARAATPFTLSR